MCSCLCVYLYTPFNCVCQCLFLYMSFVSYTITRNNLFFLKRHNDYLRSCWDFFLSVPLWYHLSFCLPERFFLSITLTLPSRHLSQHHIPHFSYSFSRFITYTPPHPFTITPQTLNIDKYPFQHHGRQSHTILIYR